MRKIKLETHRIYHVYNRGAGKQEVFKDEKDYFAFLRRIWEFNNGSTYEQRQYLKNKEQAAKESEIKKEPDSEASESGSFLISDSVKNIDLRLFRSLFDFLSKLPKLVEIICYCLLDNHYHFILKQLVDNGIEIFMRKLGTGYSNYFNSRHNRSGFLCEQRFRAYPILSENKLAWLSGYVNCNSEIHKLGKSESWQFSSFKDYLNLRNGKLVNKNIILELFNNNVESYGKYCHNVIKEAQEEKKAQQYLLDLDE